ncbi:MAG: LCP family protein [Lachnospiraceae bacterium]|nr:LCP family protein [Candidatus Minthocola equi]
MEEFESRKQKPKKKKSVGRVLLIILTCILGLIFALALTVFIYAYSKYSKLGEGAPEPIKEEEIYVNPEVKEKENQGKKPTSSPFDPTTPAQPTKSYTTIMLYGVDTFSNSELSQWGNADSEIICCIDDETKAVKLISVLRDTFVETTTGKHNKLTDIYSAYGVKESLGTINKCFDLQITKYASVNWRTIAKAVNALGGIDLHLSSKEVDYIIAGKDGYSARSGIKTGDLVNRGSDTYHLDGIQTLTHASNRTTGHHDLSRAERQRDILKAMLAAAKQCSFSELEDVIDAILPGVSTNLDLTEILAMALDVTKYHIDDTTLFPFKYWDQSNLRTAYVYCNTLTSNVTELHEYQYGEVGYEPANTVRRISDYIVDYRKEHP